MKFTDEQEAVFEAVELHSGHVRVVSDAGTGKSTTMVESLLYEDPRRRTLGTTFSVKDKEELRRRVPSGVIVNNVHGCAFSGLIHKRPKVDKRIDWKRAREAFRACRSVFFEENRSGSALRMTERELVKWAHKAISIHKNGFYDPQVWGVLGKKTCKALIDHAVKATLDEWHSSDPIISFDDQLFLADVLDARLSKYGAIYVDEYQDLNKRQWNLVQKMLAPDGRIVAFGDPHQAIFGFRGGDPSLVGSLEAKEIRMSISWRCDKLIAEKAAEIVPGFQSGTGEGGRLIEADVYRMLDPMGGIYPDIVMARNNSELIWFWEVLGARIDRKIHCTSFDDLSELFDLPTGLLEEMADRQDGSSDDARAVLRAKALGLRNTPRDQADLILSTVHKFKGREANRVGLLAPTFNAYTKAEAVTEEDLNILYVGITRAKHELIYLS